MLGYSSRAGFFSTALWEHRFTAMEKRPCGAGCLSQKSQVSFTWFDEVRKAHRACGGRKPEEGFSRVYGESPNVVSMTRDRSRNTGAANAIFYNQVQVCCPGSRALHRRKGPSIRSRRRFLPTGIENPFGPRTETHHGLGPPWFFRRAAHPRLQLSRIRIFGRCEATSRWPRGQQGYFVNPRFRNTTKK